MDTHELNKLLDEFEDVFAQAGEEVNPLNMDKMSNGSSKLRVKRSLRLVSGR